MASHSIGSRYQPHFYQVPATSMLVEAVRNLSVSELLRALNEKLGLECTRIRNISTSHTVPAASLKSEVSTRLPTPVPWAQRWGLTPVCHIDRKSRNQSTRCSKVHPLFTEHVAASQQVVTGDPFSYRSILSRSFQRGHERYPSTNSRVPILARIHHIHPGKLDDNLRLPKELDGGELGARKGSSSGNSSRHGCDTGRPPVPRPAHTPLPKHSNPTGFRPYDL